MAFLSSAAKAQKVGYQRGPQARAALQSALDEITGHQAAAVADLGTNVTSTYVEAEVQGIVDKLDALLTALRAAGVIAT